MSTTLAEIAAALGAPVVGDPAIEITGAAEPAEAGPTHIAIAMKPSFAEDLGKGRARAALMWAGADWQSYALGGAILVPRPRVALAGLTSFFADPWDEGPGVHSTALIHPEAKVGADVSVGPYAVIGRAAEIGDRCSIGAHVIVAPGAVIGADCRLHDGVRIARRVRIGDRLIAQPGAVIGSDGFSFVTPEKSGAEAARETLGDRGEVKDQAWLRIHSLGGVEIGDDVEIGANTTIDAGTIRATRIGRGTKLDNLVQIGHNVVVGEDALLCAQVGVAGSTRIGNRVVLGGQSGVSDNIFVGDDVVAGGASAIFTNVPAGRVILGSPAIKMDAHIESTKAIRRLPRLFRAVKDLQETVSKLEDND